ncbi:energy transducer TonB [Desulfovibrio sp. SGI.169]|uniref:energy transducer TonB n=1 Tax=Desulfovibrio sp. SGI.169 TaxID=3420561 RepID=UPI003D021998
MDHEGVFAPGQLDHPPTPLRRVRPEYPPEARKKRTEGRVLVRMIVDSKGLPTQCAIHAAAPPGYFEAAALEAARKMRFSPGRKDGRAVRTTVLLPFDFKLR